MFFDKVMALKDTYQAPICLGIDPSADNIPQEILNVFEGDRHELVDQVSSCLLKAGKGLVGIVKFQSAYFEALGGRGLDILERQIFEAKKFGYLVLLDAKRGDIGSTMKSYGIGAFEYLKADALTIQPYMGSEVVTCLEPWLKAGKGVYAVVLSSNPTGSSIQDEILEKSGEPMFLHVIRSLARESKGLNASLGLVIGATRIGSLPDHVWRELMAYPLLMPGIGFQAAVLPEHRTADILRGSAHLFPISRGFSMVDPEIGNENIMLRYIAAVRDAIRKAAKVWHYS